MKRLKTSAVTSAGIIERTPWLNIKVALLEVMMLILALEQALRRRQKGSLLERTGRRTGGAGTRACVQFGATSIMIER